MRGLEVGEYCFGGPRRPDHRIEQQGLERGVTRTEHCGIRTPGRGMAEAMGGVFYAVPVTLLEVDPDELAAAPIHYVDGRNDRFDRSPADTRLL